MTRLKSRIKEIALDQAVASGESEAINRYLAGYDRLNYEQETRAYLERNRLVGQRLEVPARQGFGARFPLDGDVRGDGAGRSTM